MLVVKKRNFFFVFAVYSLLLLILGFVSYYIINKYDSFNPEQRKFFSENIVYFAIIAFVITVFLFIYLYAQSVKVFIEFNKISESVKYGNYDSIVLRKRLGRLGQEISDLFSHLNDVSRKKSSKISSLSEICNFLFENIDLNLIVIDCQGMIMHVSDNLADLFGVNKVEILYHYISEYNLFDTKQLILNLSNSHDSVSFEECKFSIYDHEILCNLTCYQIFNSKQELSNVVIVVNPNRLVKFNNNIIKNIAGNAKKTPQNFSKFITNFFK